MLMFLSFVFVALLFGYVEWRCVLMLDISLWIKIGFSVFLALGIFNMPVVFFYGQYLPKWINLMFAVAWLLLIYMLMATIALDILRLFGAKSPYISYALTLLCVAVAFIAVWRSTLVPSVKNVEIASDEMPMGYKIVQLSDFHIGQGFDGKWLDEVVKKTNEQQADLIVITGDSIDKTAKKLASEMEVLSKLNAPVYMVFGNHEYYYGAAEWKKAFEKMGIKVMRNEHVVIDKKFVLGGGDWGAWYHDGSGAIANVFKNAPIDMPKILLAHYPKAFKEAKLNDVFLTLSGHTHGGMSVPIMLVTKIFNDGYLRGLYTEDGKHLYVSDGTGLWSGIPARLGSSNEITVITFKPTKNKL